MAKKFLDNNGLSYFWSKIKGLLANKVDKVEGKGLSTNDYTTTEKTKLAGIETGANKTTVDSALSTSSTNPVQNKVIAAELGKKADNDMLASWEDEINAKFDTKEDTMTAITNAEIDTILAS